MSFIDKIKERAKFDKKTIILPESMDSRVMEASTVRTVFNYPQVIFYYILRIP